MLPTSDSTYCSFRECWCIVYTLPVRLVIRVLPEDSAPISTVRDTGHRLRAARAPRNTSLDFKLKKYKSDLYDASDNDDKFHSD